MEDLSVLPKSDVSSLYHKCNMKCDCDCTKQQSKLNLVLYNLILSKHKTNSKFNGHRNAERLVQETIQRYMLDLTGYLSEAG